MKKRCALISLFLLISPLMIYSMKEDSDSVASQEVETVIEPSPLTRYLEQEDDEYEYLGVLNPVEDKARVKHRNIYEKLLIKVSEKDLSKKDRDLLRTKIQIFFLNNIGKVEKIPANKKYINKKNKEYKEITKTLEELEQLKKRIQDMSKNSKKSDTEKVEPEEAPEVLEAQVHRQIEKAPTLSLSDDQQEGLNVLFVKQVAKEIDKQVSKKTRTRSKKKHKKRAKKSKTEEVQSQEAPQKLEAEFKKGDSPTGTVAPLNLADDYDDCHEEQTKSKKTKSKRSLKKFLKRGGNK